MTLPQQFVLAEIVTEVIVELVEASRKPEASGQRERSDNCTGSEAILLERFDDARESIGEHAAISRDAVFPRRQARQESHMGGLGDGRHCVEVAKYEASLRVAASQRHRGGFAVNCFKTIEPQGVEGDKDDPYASVSFTRTRSACTDQRGGTDGEQETSVVSDDIAASPFHLTLHWM